MYCEVSRGTGVEVLESRYWSIEYLLWNVATNVTGYCAIAIVSLASESVSQESVKSQSVKSQSVKSQSRVSQRVTMFACLATFVLGLSGVLHVATAPLPFTASDMKQWVGLAVSSRAAARFRAIPTSPTRP